MRWENLGKKGNAYGLLVGIPESKRQLGRPSHGWEDNITMDLKEIGIEGFYGGFIWLRMETCGGIL